MISELIKGPVTWVDVYEPTDSDIERLATEFNIPPLLVQDWMKPEHLPKYEEADGAHFMMLRCHDAHANADAITIQGLTRKIAFFIRENHIMTIHRVRLDFLEKIAIKNRLPQDREGLLHHLLLGILRTFEAPIDQLQDTYDGFEKDILSKRCESLSTKKIYRFRRKLFVLKRMLKQTSDSLYRGKGIWEEKPSLYQDLKENIDQLYYNLDEISDNFDHLYQLFLSITDQRANEVMKVLTVFSSILLPLNFIASFYGMNFRFLPGLESHHSFALVLIVMVFICIAGIWYFKKRGWFVIPEE